MLKQLIVMQKTKKTLHTTSAVECWFI